MWNVICSNRLLEHKMRQEEHRRHRHSLRNVKPILNITSPPSFAFLTANPKKAQQRQQHLQEIQLVNTDLVRRMTSLKKDSSFLTHEKWSRQHSNSKRTETSISKENHKLLERLRDTSSSINFCKLEKEHQMTQRLKANLSRTRPSSSTTKKSFLRPMSAR